MRQTVGVEPPLVASSGIIATSGIAAISWAQQHRKGAAPDLSHRQVAFVHRLHCNGQRAPASYRLIPPPASAGREDTGAIAQMEVVLQPFA